MIKRYLKILITLIISIIIIISPCISKAVEETEGGGSSEENVQVTVETAINKLNKMRVRLHT